ncbi:hypothetical protein [Rhodopirellula sp. SWK7]|uniref:hypothetical protein n=1 Tax=Rhodopirellula sp. SWK7 TaxID=595460 RepID=UPI0002BD31CD|nr:hypothetical protein [Rhodopirellula sp. SWK7]EMI41879.1 hypothetical protein RRSWK_05694 [Rhodopirellula sp. SWK7]
MFLFSLEGFSPAALSCYGASWNRTEAIDALAARGTAWDRTITPVADPVEQLSRWLASASFPAEQMTVVTDDERLGELPIADRIGELIVVPTRADGVALTWEETNLASLAAIAAEQLPDNPHVWMHSRFLTKCWDAPRDLFPVDQLDEEDLEPMDPSESIEHELNSVGDVRSTVPPILDEVQPPSLLFDRSDDPDWIMAWMRTYGCQIRLVDAVTELMCSVAEASGQSAMVLAGASGFALGQNRAVGHRAGPLRSCHVHVPMISSVLGADASEVLPGAGIRDRRVSSADSLPDVVAAMIKDSKTSPISPEVWAARDDERQDDAPSDVREARSDNSPSVVTSNARVNVAITTANWFYVRDGAQAQGERHDGAEQSEPDFSRGSHGLGHLFLKPDDLNDVNDVARLRHDVTEELEEKLVSQQTAHE